MQQSVFNVIGYRGTTPRPPMANTTEQSRYAVARWDTEPNGPDIWTRLSWFATYEAADSALDRWADRYPNAWVDIIDISTGKLV